MEKQSTEVTIEFLQAFAEAWNRHDIDDLMSFMTDDCVFESSAGDDVCGTRYEGAGAVRAGFSNNWVLLFPIACGFSRRRSTCSVGPISMSVHPRIRCP